MTAYSSTAYPPPILNGTGGTAWFKSPSKNGIHAATVGLEDKPAAAPAAASATQRHGMCMQKLPGSVAVDGRIVIVALYQIHIVGVRAI